MPLPPLNHWRTWVAPLPRPRGGLGEITGAATIQNSVGTGRQSLRIYGQWALVYLVSGAGEYQDAHGLVQPVRPGNWILVFPEIAHCYGPPPGGLWNEIYVTFRGPIFEVWRDAGYFDPSRPVGRWLPPKQGVKEFSDFFQAAGKRDCSALKAVAAWQHLLAKFFPDAPASHSMHPAWLETALDFLEKNSGDSRHQLQQVAQACGMGYESFRKKFEAAIGQPPGQYAQSRKIEQARRLMNRNRHTNQELAELLGFSDEFHFSKTFSRFSGMSPREYRQQLGERRTAH